MAVMGISERGFLVSLDELKSKLDIDFILGFNDAPSLPDPQLPTFESIESTGRCPFEHPFWRCQGRCSPMKVTRK